MTDAVLRALQRQVHADPADGDAKDRYIAALERAEKTTYIKLTAAENE